ncbi:MAG TPA: RagB/SusD family nutrient uptake outer membrane protein [Cyclobacteriaceae bacterium]|nr:RagB/SusD family nutrient uptake outer membrane protein [Cyclobacteriaceae bacterium]
MKNLAIRLKSFKVLASVVAAVLAGCVSLEEKPKDFPSPDNFYNTEEQIVSALTASMANLYSQWSNYSYPYQVYHTDYNDDANLVFSASHANWVWRAHYAAIANLNSAIKSLNEDKLGPTVSQDKKDELMAQAKFLRGLNYFYLVRCYGDVPIITEETDVVGGEISRQPISEVYALIQTDLQVAYNDLPEEWPEEMAGRPSRDAARALMAKVYLTMASAPLKDASKWQLARDKAKEVIDNGVHYLLPDVRDVFKIENDLGPENMFNFNSTEDDIATPPQIWLPGTMAFGWMDFGIAKAFSDAYPDQPRKAAYMVLEDWDGNPPEDYGWRGSPALRKYIYDDQEVLERLQSTANIPILRFADVLLMYAEAENMINNGPTQAAVDAVNQVIDRANDGVANPSHPRVTLTMTQQEFDDAVINERLLELFYEFDRWFDLTRKEILCDVWESRLDIKPNCDPNDYLWPIPQADLRLNPLITQNPGYTTPE